MPARNGSISVLTIATSALLIGVTGCASEGKQAVQRTQQTADSLADFRAEIASAKKQVDATTGALNKVLSQATGDRRPAFESYMKDLAKLQSQADKAKVRADDLYARADAYIARWQKEVSEVKNPELKQQAEARGAKVKERIGGIQTAARAAGDTYRPLLQDLMEIQTTLRYDLTPVGIEAVKPTATKAIADAGQLQNRLDALITQLDQVRGEVSPSGKK